PCRSRNRRKKGAGSLPGRGNRRCTAPPTPRTASAVLPEARCQARPARFASWMIFAAEIAERGSLSPIGRLALTRSAACPHHCATVQVPVSPGRESRARGLAPCYAHLVSGAGGSVRGSPRSRVGG